MGPDSSPNGMFFDFGFLVLKVVCVCRLLTGVGLVFLDPIFFLHHGMVDKVWWEWQEQDRDNRLYAYGGLRNDGQAASLDDELPMLGLADDGVVRDYMDTQGGALCYTY